MTPCRLIVDPPQSGAWNMAVDESLLDAAADRGSATLRFYRWAEPTLSLGYFQDYAERAGHSPSQRIKAVRRLSGGGALVHDREVTYSLCLPAGHPLARQTTTLYGKVHHALIAALSAWGIAARVHGDHRDDETTRSEAREPFLCFSRRTAFDVVTETRNGQSAKIVGSAQRRRRGAVLQHGSLILACSACAPELPGVLEACDAALDLGELIAAWSAGLSRAMGLEFNPGYLSAEVQSAAEQLVGAKYACGHWTRLR